MNLVPGTKSALSVAQRRLFDLMYELNFGRIEGLQVRGGQPVLDPQPRIVSERKFAGENGPRPEARQPHSPLKGQHRDLLKLLDEIGNGIILTLTVKHGIPFHAEVPR